MYLRSCGIFYVMQQAIGRLTQQIAFLAEADKLKRILRRTPLIDDSRQENSAEHSWHLLLVAIVLRDTRIRNSICSECSR